MNVLITGVGREGQIGEALAAAFAADGARLLLVDRTRANVEARAAAVRARGAEAHAFDCDLTDADALARLADDAGQALGGESLDAVVCAAGGFGPTGPLDQGSVADWDRMLAVNLATAHRTTRALLPSLRRRGGALVYFTSPAALPGAAAGGIAAYAAAKAGVIALMRAVAADERAHGVRANAVALSAVRTTANVAAMGGDGPFVEREDVARVVRWLCSAESASVTGQIVRLG
ncbi:short-chain dehydrogenase/reductase SDR [Gemmatirosa kalamazoonensis]|uniref:Short-chain dehydrogenase/reductase SDR n=1 Tax=Gemmatirosa kalamazoonensis TaxID=861299 RepID=W0RF36_9BACT|nr:SDR family oxidoreductase [Gemmatirosa kalamazoonensis]AHG87998.1 short-chain dehydrogenase/reductase SDR [Gemmatirosa kalamazoonensis]